MSHFLRPETNLEMVKQFCLSCAAFNKPNINGSPLFVLVVSEIKTRYTWISTWLNPI